MATHAKPTDTAADFDPTIGASTFVHDRARGRPLWLRIVGVPESLPEVRTSESPFLFDAADPEVLGTLFEPAGVGRPRSTRTPVGPVADTTVTARANGTVQTHPDGSYAN
jgi:hypothetical protein